MEPTQTKSTRSRSHIEVKSKWKRNEDELEVPAKWKRSVLKRVQVSSLAAAAPPTLFSYPTLIGSMDSIIDSYLAPGLHNDSFATVFSCKSIWAVRRDVHFFEGLSKQNSFQLSSTILKLEQVVCVPICANICWKMVQTIIVYIYMELYVTVYKTTLEIIWHICYV